MNSPANWPKLLHLACAAGVLCGGVPVMEVRGAGTPDTTPDRDRNSRSAAANTQLPGADPDGGREEELVALAQSPPRGLPPLVVPADNPLTSNKVRLGRKLFFDRRLSANGTMSCAMCHVPEQGFAHNEMQTAVGIEGQAVRRNAPTILNVAYLRRLFHDGRENSLETQVWSPLLAANEMANPSVGALIEKIAGLDDYNGLFEQAFGRGPGMESIGMALASYQRVLLAADSPFDRWFFDADESALTATARHGYELFSGVAGCAGCHTIARSDALFTDQQFHNTGVGYLASFSGRGRVRELAVAPGTILTVDTRSLDNVGGRRQSDLGLYELTGRPADRWKYRTPSLRNVALTAPYMHDGSLPTLEAVVRFYNEGGIENEGRDPRIRRLGLDDTDVAALVDFLEALTGSNVARLVADARGQK